MHFRHVERTGTDRKFTLTLSVHLCSPQESDHLKYQYYIEKELYQSFPVLTGSMALNLIIILLTVTGVIVMTCTSCSASPDAASDAKKNETQAICKKSMMLLAKRVVKHLNPCTKQVKAKYTTREEYKKHFQCQVKCVMNKLSIVDDNFRLSNETVETFLKQNMPEQAHDYLKGITNHCHVEWGPKLGPQTGELCLEYGEYFKCLQGVLGECDPDKLKE